MRICKFVFSFLVIMALCPWQSAAAALAIFGNFKIHKSAFQQQQDELRQQHEAFATDSLLNSIEVDSLTREVYSMFPPHFRLPKILSGLGDLQFRTVDIKAPSYSQLAGVMYAENDSVVTTIFPAVPDPSLSDALPDWFKKSLRFQNQLHDASFQMMVSNPASIDYADWNLPVPPRLPAEDFSYHAYLKRMNIPEIDVNAAVIPEVEVPKKHWLHYFNVALQFSQAYVSPNWYQGGNSYISGLFNFTWNVDLNQNFHPNLLFQSSLQYKLAINSNPSGSLHKYNISQDLFQYTLKAGFKAFNHWFYSLNLLFQTQMLNAYPADSEVRTSSFLSPGTFNAGLGMTYSLEKSKLNLTVSISPLAYNLKTCIDKYVDPAQFNIPIGKKTASEIGSSAEANLTWKFSDNISWKSRMFLFTDYHYFLADWENTFNFQINKFLSTQIYLHPRFDSSSENWGKWHHWMFHEILSFGISYTFATPK